MNAADLRHAVERYDAPIPDWGFDPPNFMLILDAARTIALPILEADPEYWLGIAINAAAETDLVGHPLSEEVLRALHTGVGAVLAAISTPTPGAE